jgi:hypothetical protein
MEATAKRTCQALGQHRLAGAGDILDQQMPLTQQTDDSLLNRLTFADDHPLDILDDSLGDVPN